MLGGDVRGTKIGVLGLSFKPDTERVILGATHLVFTPQGQISLHRDYWDAAEELYEKLPVVGSLMRWLKKRANA